jgi:hypothetical protein
VKRVDVDHDQVHVVFRIEPHPEELGSEKKSLQDCRRSKYPSLWRPTLRLVVRPLLHVSR